MGLMGRESVLVLSPRGGTHNFRLLLERNKVMYSDKFLLKVNIDPNRTIEHRFAIPNTIKYYTIICTIPYHDETVVFVVFRGIDFKSNECLLFNKKEMFYIYKNFIYDF